jgi:hypothetical protein
VAVDRLLLPAARGEAIQSSNISALLDEFRKYRTPEGFFFDLPREGTAQERLAPPTYVMKMLFLLGVCHRVHPHGDFAGLFTSGMSAALPLLTRDGTLSYVGRTDNSPFAAGLTIFNLRMAARLDHSRRGEFERAARAAEKFYTTFPRHANGLLHCTRFFGDASAAEHGYARDAYAFVGQYSLSSCAYALLGAHWGPAADLTSQSSCTPSMPRTATSADLGITVLSGSGYELCIRTHSQATSWDRRYLGPTLLRYEGEAGRLRVGAISRTISTDPAATRSPQTTKLASLASVLSHRYLAGFEQLDAPSVGYVPVVRVGTVDYVPYGCSDLVVSEARLSARYSMVPLRNRGIRACLTELGDLVRKKAPGLRPREYVRPPMRLEPMFELSRTIHVRPGSCELHDHLSGNLRGRRVMFSVRYMPGSSATVDGLKRMGSVTGWGSDGRQSIDLYEQRATGPALEYSCVIRSGTSTICK